MKLYASPSGVSCASCGYSVGFDYEPTCWKTGVIHGRCNHWGCENEGKTFRFPLATIEVEFVEEAKP